MRRNWFKNWLVKSAVKKPHVRPALGVTALEDRTVPATTLSFTGGFGADTFVLTKTESGFIANNNVATTTQAAPDLHIVVFGGDGNDTINLSLLTSDDYGTSTLTGANGNDSILGGAGVDTIDGGNNVDIIDAGAGNDVIRVQQEQGQFDTIQGGTGIDTFRVVSSNQVNLNGFSAGNGIEVFDANGQRVSGNNNDNVLDFSGIMTVLNSSLVVPSHATAGLDISGGGFGNDTITGTKFNDIINGLAGNDTIDGGAGTDTINGGTGNDTITTTWRAWDNDVIDGGGNSDTVKVVFTPQQLDDMEEWSGLVGLNAYVTAPTQGTTTLTLGGSAAFQVKVTGFEKAVIGVQDHDGTVYDAPGTIDKVWIGDEYYNAPSNSFGGNDLIVDKAPPENGWAFNGTLNGGAGNDIIFGGNGDDTFIGGDGADILVGGIGNDTFISSFGDLTYDVLFGGAGTDAIMLSTQRNPSDAIKLNGFSPANGIEAIRGGSRVEGTDEANTLNFSNVTEWTTGKVIRGNDGNDAITAPSGLGGFNITGGDGADTITGGDGNDVIDGGKGDDTIDGGAGDDLIRGGTGFNTLTGGAGIDTFFFHDITEGQSDQTIKDFSGNDKLKFQWPVSQTILTGTEAVSKRFVWDMSTSTLFLPNGKTLTLSGYTGVVGLNDMGISNVVFGTF